MTVLITLTTAGADSGPFDLYTNLDGYVSAFATGVSKSALLAGYASSAVPDFATIIRVKSTGDCVNYIDITLVGTTTTTTTTLVPSVPCEGTTDSGGLELKDQYVNLDPDGGVITFLFDPLGQVDKLEIYHGLPENGGVNKKSTTSMTATTNNNVFDNIWGTPPDNLLPNDPNLPVDQFIGTNKGVAPTRQSEFTIDTGYDIPNMTISGVTYDQIVWWKYTSADYLINPIATIRATGGSAGTAWYSIRACPTTTTTTTIIL
jgi:hypothetical protein